MKSIMLNGVEYVEKTEKESFAIREKERKVCVVNRGWKFYGDSCLDHSANRINLTNGGMVFKWNNIGFSEVIRNPKDENCDLREIKNKIEIPLHSLIYSVNVEDNWNSNNTFNYDEEIEGNRYVVILDRGWIYAGDVTRRNGMVYLKNCVWVFKWESIGFNGMINDPKDINVDLRKIDNVIEFPELSEIFSVKVHKNWGI